jgi:hypothetical protein
MGDIGAFQPHDALLCTPIAEKVNAAIPDDLLVSQIPPAKPEA